MFLNHCNDNFGIQLFGFYQWANLSTGALVYLPLLHLILYSFLSPLSEKNSRNIFRHNLVWMGGNSRTVVPPLLLRFAAILKKHYFCYQHKFPSLHFTKFTNHLSVWWIVLFCEVAEISIYFVNYLSTVFFSFWRLAFSLLLILLDIYLF